MLRVASGLDNAAVECYVMKSSFLIKNSDFFALGLKWKSRIDNPNQKSNFSKWIVNHKPILQTGLQSIIPIQQHPECNVHIVDFVF